MKKSFRMKITPKFKYTDITHKAFGLDWGEFQLHAYNTGATLLHYMKDYINNNTKRAGSKGKLESSITFEPLSTTSMISWGIGNISQLNAQAKHWYVINYGKKIDGKRFVPFNGQIRPVEFADGPADPAKRGKGSSQATKFRRVIGGASKPSPIRPMHYIEATQRMLISHITALLLRYGKK